MPGRIDAAIAEILAEQADPILQNWLALLRRNRDERISMAELEIQCRGFITSLSELSRSDGVTAATGPDYEALRELLADFSRSRAVQGFSPSEIATFVFSLKQPLFAQIRTACAHDPALLADVTWAVSSLVDSLGLHMMETYQQTREEVIVRQQEELAELSTPVVKLWDGILALPLIGTLDSSRTQVVMENLLDSIVRHEADIAIIDITGVPTVDTLVAQHLLKTIAAARLMGADCIISGIRPQIAQTMVHLGVELNVISKANLADAFGLALRRLGRGVVRLRQAAGEAGSSNAQ